MKPSPSGHSVSDKGVIKELERLLSEEREARRRIEETLAEERFLLNALMDAIPEHLYFKDRDCRFIRINTFLAKTFNLADPAEARGKTDADFFSPEHARQARADELDIMESGQSILLEERETWSDRPDTWVSTTKAPLRDADGNIVGTFGISKDITQRKFAQAQLETQMRELNALNAQLVETQNELIRAEKNASLVRIIAGISHKLNTPLGNGKLALSALSDEIAITREQLSSGRMTLSGLLGHLATCDEATRIVRDSIESALHLVSDFRSVIVDYEFEAPAAVTVAPLVQDIIEHVRQTNRHTRLCATNNVGAGFVVVTYRDLLTRVLTELIKNALIHGAGEKSDVTVRISAERNGDRSMITVEDDGVGLPEKDGSHVFDGFFTTRLGSANGLGLVIVYNIVTGPLHGRIDATNLAEGGARFIITLPESPTEDGTPS